MRVSCVIRRWWAYAALCVVPWAPLVAAEPTPLVRAHAHNDYEHTRPLLDALEQGFCSVEADVWLVDGTLLVAHDRDKVNSGRTLESLYLMPLHERVRANGGRVFRGGPVFTLLIDFKSDAEATYAALKTALARHAEVFTRFTPEGIQTNAILAIISGNRPLDLVAAETNRLAALDGRLSDLDRLPPVHVMPLISDNWRSHFEWNGEGEPKEAETSKLRSLVARLHENQRRVRFWGSPDTAAAWKLQFEAGADLINTDKLEELSAWLKTVGR